MPEALNIQGTLHLDSYLTGFQVSYAQESGMFIAQRAAAAVQVMKQTDKYRVYDRGYFWRDESQPRPLGGRPVQVGYKLDEDTYSAVEYALEHVVDDRQRANVDDDVSLDENATRLLTGKQLIKMDRVWAQTFFKSGLWSFDYTGVASSPGGDQFLQFNDANSDPIGTIDEAKEAMAEITGFMPNTLVLGANVKKRLRTHPDLADRIKYTQTGIADEAIMSALFEIPNVMTARSVYNSAAEGATDNIQYIVDKNGFWLGYIDPNPTFDSPTAIALFAWTGLLPGLTNALGGVVERGRDDRAHSDWFQSRMAWDMKPVALDLGAYFASAVTG